MVTRAQLLDLGLSSKAIDHRLARGRLHRVWRGVYRVGTPELSEHGRWLAAVLRCGPEALLSHESAAALWGMRRRVARSGIDVSVPLEINRDAPGLRVHRRRLNPIDRSRSEGIPVTGPALTLLDLATVLTDPQLEAAVNEADKRDLINPEELRDCVENRSGSRGVPRLRRVLDRRTFTLTDSELERQFLRLVRKAGLPLPQTGSQVNDFRVDFFWPELGLIVETDGLRYHRTPAQQTKDRVRDQAHAAAGLTPLRFTHAQVTREPAAVISTLRTVASRLQGRASLAE